MTTWPSLVPSFVRLSSTLGHTRLQKNHSLKRCSKFSSFDMKFLWDGINKISNKAIRDGKYLAPSSPY